MNMKRITSIIIALTVFAGSAIADEGMWLLPLLEKMNGKAMKELGCELTPKQIYDINNTSLKDAIVQFGGGCTGEIISKDGLLVTNHHCGYSNIQKLSSVEHDYLKDGYWAMNRGEELPCEGLSVKFLESMTDVTAVLEKARKDAEKQFRKDENKEKLVAEAVEKAAVALAEEAEKANPYCEADVQSFYDTNVHYLIIYIHNQRYLASISSRMPKSSLTVSARSMRMRVSRKLGIPLKMGLAAKWRRTCNMPRYSSMRFPLVSTCSLKISIFQPVLSRGCFEGSMPALGAVCPNAWLIS